MAERSFVSEDDLKERTIIGAPCLEPRVENIPVRMPLPHAKECVFNFQNAANGWDEKRA